MEVIIALAVLAGFFWVGFQVTGAMLSALIWLVIKLPIATVVFCLGLACCATLLLIPVGLKLFGAAGRILF
jgi:hypothetical protein